ncbi:hypothetical protein [Variovorax sp. J22R115]|uniref:hypothetical protein n=1 Tax=Variovorax sp. J22R115 TaxID=3053509 RepID=UPI00257693D7|nr:hypothetical protein [Variovorax sp. J22R115]MDM0047840.1 hypothetical protein [Variovorax sp. J22R115]
MLDQSVSGSKGRVSRDADRGQGRHPLASAWSLFKRLASARTAAQLDALADRYQSSQPALAAEFRAAAFATSARGA